MFISTRRARLLTATALLALGLADIAFADPGNDHANEVRTQAAQGDADAQYDLGERYAPGLGVPIRHVGDTFFSPSQIAEVVTTDEATAKRRIADNPREVGNSIGYIIGALIFWGGLLFGIFWLSVRLLRRRRRSSRSSAGADAHT